MKAVIFCFYDKDINIIKNKDIIDGTDLFVCADCGIYVAKALGIKDYIFIGDMDSSDISQIEASEIIKLPEKKNDTDTMYAIKYALDKGADEIIIVGGVSENIPHTLANIQALKYASDAGAKSRICSYYDIYIIKNDSIEIKGKENGEFSVFSLSPKSQGVYIENAKYPLSDATLSNNYPIGVSNAFLNCPVKIDVLDGELLILV